MAPPHTSNCTPRPIRAKGRHPSRFFANHGIINSPESRRDEYMDFSKLPNELLLLIGKFLPQAKDLYALIQTNRRFAVLMVDQLRKVACGDKLLSTTALFYAAASGDRGFVRALLHKGTEITILEHNNNSNRYDTIHETPDEYCEDLFEFVLREGVDLVLEYDYQQFTALRWAIYTEDKKLTTLLLLNGANIRFKTYVWYGTGPLHAAVILAKPEMVRFLLDNGFDIETKDFKGCTALQVAARTRTELVYLRDMIMLLLSRGAGISAIDKAARKLVLEGAAHHCGWGNVMKLLFRGGAPINASDSTGAIVLYVAAAPGHPDIMSVLMDPMAEVFLREYDDDESLQVSIKGRRDCITYALALHRDMNRRPSPFFRS